MALFKKKIESEELDIDLNSLDLGNVKELQEMDITKDMLEKELQRETYRSNYSKALRNTIFLLIVVAAIAVLLAMLFFPVLKISGTSMTNTLQDKDITVAMNTKKFDTGEIVAFYSNNNNILVKRVIASAGQWVDIDDAGNVFVDGEMLDEPYVSEKAFGECDIKLPYQVPDGKIFVLGDHRSVSIDSRNKKVGCIDIDNVVGKIVFRVLPVKTIGFIK